MPDIFVAKRVIDYVGLGSRGIPEHTIPLNDKMQPTLALLQAMGSDGAKLVNVDANGNLGVTMIGAASVSPVGILDTANGNRLSIIGSQDALGVFNRPLVSSEIGLWNNAATDRLRSASAANLAAQSGLGAALADNPGDWSVFSAPAVGVAASASRAAGGVGVRHICTGFTFGFSATVALAAIATLTINLRDGATGAGVILKSLQFTLPAAVIAPFALQLTGLHLVGTAATAMTVEVAAAIGNLLTFCDISGHDAS